MAGTTFRFEAIGTHWRIDVPEELTPSVRALLEQKIMNRINEFDCNYSRFRNDSLVATMSKHEGKYTLPDDGPKLFHLYERVYALTKGKVTPLIGDLMEEAGYDKDYSFRVGTLHTPLEWDDALAFDGTNLTIKRPVLLDVGAAGKGYLIDLVGDVLQHAGQTTFTIDAGGDIIHRSKGGDRLRVGLEHPLDLTKVIGVVELGEESICGSAGNRRAWDKFTHIIDPTLLASPTEIIATWAIAESTLLADMLATCLFFTPAKELLRQFTFKYILLHKDFSVEHSGDIRGEFY